MTKDIAIHIFEKQFICAKACLCELINLSQEKLTFFTLNNPQRGFTVVAYLLLFLGKV